MQRRRRQHISLSLALVLAALLGAAAQASLLGVSLTLRADPERAPADGSTPIVISAEVMDSSGMPVPDGTPVNFITTLGEIVSPVHTLGGVAQTVLKPSNTAGPALVSAMAGASRASIEVEFVGGAGSAAPGSRMVEITAEELSYNPDRKFFIGGPEAQITYQGIEIRADGLQYDVMKNVVFAQGAVRLASGKTVLAGDALRYQLGTMRGRLLKVGDEAELLLVEGDRLQTRPDPDSDPCLWYHVPTVEQRTWLKARSAIVDPRNRVILDHAAFYVDDLRVMGLRRHVLDPRRGAGLFGDTFGYSSLFGPNMDLPIYYRASGSQVGAVHITRNRGVTGLGADTGWSFGLREEYFREGGNEGVVSIEDVTDPGRALQWRHQIKLPKGAGLSLDASTATFDEDSPRLRAGGLSYFQPTGGGRLSLSLSGSDFGTSVHYYGALSYRLKASRLKSGILINPVVHLRHSRRHSEAEEAFVDPDTGEILQLSTENTGSTTSPGLDLSISLPRRRVDPRTELNVGIRSGYAWGLDGGPRSIFDARLALTRELGAGEYVKLDYTYSGGPSSLHPSPFVVGRQRLALMGRTVVKGYDLRFNASHEIGGERLFGHASMVRDLPWGKDSRNKALWRVQANHMFSHLEDYQVSSTRFALDRQLGRYRLALCYSPQGFGTQESQPYVGLDGFGYTYSGGRHLWLELHASGYY
jgi:hypothetical protein